MAKRPSNLSSTTEDLFVEVFEDFVDLPDFSFTGKEPFIHKSEDLEVSFLVAGHYVVYKAVYCMLPESHPEAVNFLVYNIDELENNRRKVYKFFTRNMEEITLGEATYDIGILFSGARVFAETHFIEMGYRS